MRHGGVGTRARDSALRIEASLVEDTSYDAVIVCHSNGVLDHVSLVGTAGGVGVEGVPNGFSPNPLNEVLLIDMRLYLENDILVKLDRASMMASLEGRVPLLNNDFVEFAGKRQ